MAIRQLTLAELAQRRAAGPRGGRPKKYSGMEAARRAVEKARDKGKRVTTEAVDVLIAGMRGQLRGQSATDQITSAKEILNRFGCPPLAQTQDVGNKPDTHLHLNLEGAHFPPPLPKPESDADGPRH